jgi:hypothetical protein
MLAAAISGTTEAVAPHGDMPKKKPAAICVKSPICDLLLCPSVVQVLSLFSDVEDWKRPAPNRSRFNARGAFWSAWPIALKAEHLVAIA